jgi:hypothetical protein
MSGYIRGLLGISGLSLLMSALRVLQSLARMLLSGQVVPLPALLGRTMSMRSDVM